MVTLKTLGTSGGSSGGCAVAVSTGMALICIGKTNTYQEFWSKWISPQKAAEIYARTVSNLADNAIVTTRIANNVMFANMEALKTIIERRKDDVKEFSRMAVNTAKTFEQTSKDTAQAFIQHGSSVR